MCATKGVPYSDETAGARRLHRLALTARPFSKNYLRSPPNSQDLVDHKV